MAAAVAGVPFMSPEQGRVIYDHVRSARPAEVLELGGTGGADVVVDDPALVGGHERHAGHGGRDVLEGQPFAAFFAALSSLATSPLSLSPKRSRRSWRMGIASSGLPERLSARPFSNRA